MSFKFKKGINKEHKVELESKLVAVQWLPQIAFAGQSAAWEVRTVGVGSGAPVKVTGTSEKGTKLGSVSGSIKSNAFRGSFDIPEDIEPGDSIIIEVELKKNSLDGESLPIPVRPKVTVSNMKWDKEKVKRGDLVTLTADVRGLNNGESVKLRIYEFEPSGAHFSNTELDGTVRDGKIEVKWVFEYFDNTEDIPDQDDLEPRDQAYAQPEYFFTVVAGNDEYGKSDQASGKMKFEDVVAFQFLDEDGLPLADHDFSARFSDGSTRDGTTDSEGWARLQDVPPGRIKVDFPGAGRFMLEQEDA